MVPTKKQKKKYNSILMLFLIDFNGYFLNLTHIRFFIKTTMVERLGPPSLTRKQKL